MKSIDYIRQHYGVPAEIGGKIKFEGTPGVITGTTDHYLVAQLDGEDYPATLHPTWHVTYDAAPGEAEPNSEAVGVLHERKQA